MRVWWRRLAALMLVFALLVPAVFLVMALVVAGAPALASVPARANAGQPDCVPGEAPPEPVDGDLDGPYEPALAAPSEALDGSGQSVLYTLRGPAEKRFLHGYPERARGQGHWGGESPVQRKAHDAISRCITESTSVVLGGLDEILSKISKIDTGIEIEVGGFKLDFIVCAITLTLVFSLWLRIELICRSEAVSIEELRKDLKRDLKIIKRCACGRLDCDCECDHKPKGKSRAH